MTKLDRFALTGIVASWLAVVACSSSPDDAARAALADGCIVNTDCNAPLVCAFQRCHNACSDSRDCPSNERCVASDRPFHVCQLAEERDCSYNSQCGAGELCGVDGQCRDQCAADRDCVPGQVCIGGTCAEPSELVDGGLNVIRGDAASATGTPCSYNSQCPDPQICRAGTCAVECLGDRDCAGGATCVDSRCKAPASDGGPLPDGSTSPDGGSDASDATLSDGTTIPDGAPDGYGGACALPSDCTFPLVCTFGHCAYQCNTPLDCMPTYCCSAQHTCVTGSVCSGGGSDAGASDAAIDAAACSDDSDCQDGVKCNGAERCVGGRCAAASELLCDDRNPCTTDACTESNGTCTHTATGPLDNDHDGHYAIACGGTADDCDDNDLDVYPGHAELCDGVDNNCNGVADEGVWSVAAPVTVGSGAYTADVGAPGIVHFNDGTFGIVIGEPRGTTGLFDGVHLSSTLGSLQAQSLATIGGSMACGSAGARDALYTSAATDGTTLGATTLSGTASACGCCGGANECGNWTSSSLAFSAHADLTSATSSTLATLATPFGCGSFTARASAPRIAFNPTTSTYAIAWSDTHLGTDSVAHVYVASMTTAGGVSSAHQVVPTLANETVDPSAFTVTPVAVGPSSVLVAWTSYAVGSNGHFVRYALMDSNLATVVRGPFDLTQPEDYAPVSAAFVGTSFALAAQNVNGSSTRVHRIDATTGAELASVALASPANGGDARLAAVHGGWAITLSHVTRVAFGWAPETLDGGFFVTETAQGATVSGAGVTMIDAKHAAIAWQDGQLRAAIATCGP